jgi:ribose transport system permease protein
MSTQVENMTIGAETADQRSPGARQRRFRVDRYATLLFFLCFFGVIGILKGSAFLSWSNLSLVLANNANVALLAAAATLTLIAGQFDLSVGAAAGMSSIIATHLAVVEHTSVVIMLLAVIVVGMLAGILNALLVTRAHVNAFVATLGTAGLFGGVALWISKGETVFGVMPQILTNAGTSKVASVPLPIIYTLIVGAALWLLTKRTVLGRFWYATGANPDSADLAGVPVRRVTTYAFIATTVLAVVAGLLASARFGSADPSSGPDLLLPAFAAAFLGSAILSDGRFTVVGSLLAASLIVYAANGLDVAGVNAAIQPMFNGAVLVGAVALTEFLRRRSGQGSLLARANR